MPVEVATGIKPHIVEQRWFTRLLEIIPGLVTWIFILGPVILSVVEPILVAYFIIAFDLFWLIKSFRLSYHLIRGYNRLHLYQKVDWNERLRQLEDIPAAIDDVRKKIGAMLQQSPNIANSLHLKRSARRQSKIYREMRSWLEQLLVLEEKQSVIIKPAELLNVVIIATYNESLDVLEPTVQALLSADYPASQLMLVIAYEERGGEETELNANELLEKYGKSFAYAMAVKHPDGLPGEAKVKGANISYAARQVTKILTEQNVNPDNVIVTTFDADNRPSRNYFSYLSFSYAVDPNRQHRSFQPIPMFYNNIWDVPAPMRVVSTGNSFWIIVEAMRPHRLRNFAAHAQGLKALIDTDYWSVTSIVEDGHQFWRTYFTYDGDHAVVPLFTPVYQDAVLAGTYLKTMKAQYVQLRRWAWGVSDFVYVVKNFIGNKRIHWFDKVVQATRLFEGHFSWATAPLILTFVAWLPLYLNQPFSQQALAHNLPRIASRILTVTMLGLVTTVLISLISLPPKPPRYRPTRFISMVAQWALMPVVAICFGAFAAIDSQTRLMLGKYLDWRVTEKAVKK
jgi:hypothetical protein